MKASAIWLPLVLGLAFGAPVFAESMATNDAKMTLYTFDKDTGGKSACYDDCAANWPPYLGMAGATKGEGWTLVERTDGTHQWAYDGKPTYLYIGDTAPGDMLGNGKGGLWHVITD